MALKVVFIHVKKDYPIQSFKNFEFYLAGEFIDIMITVVSALYAEGYPVTDLNASPEQN